MEAQALQRKERLMALKARLKRTTEDEKFTLRFRNYEPLNEDLKEGVVEPVPIGPTAKEAIPTVEGTMEKFAQDALLEEKKRKKEVVRLT